jgi:hypothetical protein
VSERTVSERTDSERTDSERTDSERIDSTRTREEPIVPARSEVSDRTVSRCVVR